MSIHQNAIFYSQKRQIAALYTTAVFFSVTNKTCEPLYTKACDQDCERLLGGTGGGKCGPVSDQQTGKSDTCVCATGYTMVKVNEYARVCRKNT